MSIHVSPSLSLNKFVIDSYVDLVEVQLLFKEKDWISAVTKYATNSTQFVELVKTHMNYFKQSIISTLQEQSTEHLPINAKILFLMRLNTICAEGGDAFLIPGVLQDSEVKPFLPTLFRSQNKLNKMDMDKSFETIFQKLVPIAKLINEKWSEVSSSLKQYHLFKVSKKEIKLPSSVYFINLTQIFVYVKGGLLGEGTSKKQSSLVPLTGGGSLARAKGKPYNEKSHSSDYTLEEWNDEILQAFAHSIEITQMLRDKKAPGIPWVVPLRHNEEISTLSLEYQEGSLRTFLKSPLELEEKIPLLFKILEALEGMHEVGVCHLDFKSENIVVAKKKTEKQIDKKTDFNVGIIDFEVARRVDSNPFSSLLSSLPSPENAKNYLADKKTQVSYAHDLWALGDVLYFIGFGESLLGNAQLTGKELQYEDRLQSNKKSLQKALNSNISETDKLVKLQELAEVQKTLDEWTKNKWFFEDKLEIMQNYLKENFAKPENAYEECMVRLFSIDPKQRPSVKEVRAKISEWWNQCK